MSSIYTMAGRPSSLCSATAEQDRRGSRGLAAQADRIPFPLRGLISELGARIPGSGPTERFSIAVLLSIYRQFCISQAPRPAVVSSWKVIMIGWSTNERNAEKKVFGANPICRRMAFIPIHSRNISPVCGHHAPGKSAWPSSANIQVLVQFKRTYVRTRTTIHLENRF